MLKEKRRPKFPSLDNITGLWEYNGKKYKDFWKADEKFQKDFMKYNEKNKKFQN